MNTRLLDLMPRCLFVALTSLLITFSAAARTVTVKTPADLEAEVKAAAPGDTILLEPGEWKDMDVRLSAQGNPDQPVVIRAAEPGKVVITGRSAIRLAGRGIVLQDLYFKGVVPPDGAEAIIAFRESKDHVADDCRLTGLFFEDCNPADPAHEYPWVRVYGKNHRIDHSRFSGQNHKGRAIQIRVYEDAAGHRIDHNHFVDRAPGLESNGYEVIQVGLSSSTGLAGKVVIHRNIFERCDGETEIISIKSDDNIVSENLFLESSGTVTLRHGTGSRVLDNTFIGRGKEESGGVRIVDAGHVVSGNYFSGLTGRTGAVVVFYCGIPDSPANGYFPASDTRLSGNVFHANSGNDVYLTGGYGQRNRILLPERVTIADNYFGLPASTGSVAVAGSLPDVAFAGNRYAPGVELGRADPEGMEITEATETPDSPRPPVPTLHEVGPSWDSGLPELLLLDRMRLKSLAGGIDAAAEPAARLDSLARAALENPGIYSVTTNDKLPPSGDRHDYYSTGPYWWPNPETPDGLPYIRIDGKFNPERDRVSDREPLHAMVRDVRVLAAAHARTGDRAYARRAVDLLRAWFLDKATRMRPNLNHAQAIPGVTEGRGTGIIDTHPFAELVDALVLLEASGELTAQEAAGLRAWFREFSTWLLLSDNGRDERAASNNHGTAYDLQVAALLWYTGQEDRLRQYLQEVTRPRIAAQILPDGRQPKELSRTRTWSYCTENLEHFFKLGLIGRHIGVDLFHHSAASGGSLKAALDYLLPFVCEPESWPHPQETEWQDGFIRSVLAIADGVYQDDNYKKALDCLGPGAGPWDYLLRPES